MRNSYTPKMLQSIRDLQKADNKRPGADIDMHARTAWALANRGLVVVDGAAAYRRADWVSVYLTPAGRVFCTRVS